MSALTRTPKNPNILHGNKFQLNFSRNPNVQYFCQSVVVPGISLSEVPKSNPFVEAYSPGDKAVYDILNVTFIIDEELQAWKEVHDWIRAMTFPNNFDEYANLKNIARPVIREGFPQFSDCAITILSSANQPLYMFKFTDVFPVSISSFSMSTMDSPDNIITADATFRYTYYDIQKLY